MFWLGSPDAETQKYIHTSIWNGFKVLEDLEAWQYPLHNSQFESLFRWTASMLSNITRIGLLGMLAAMGAVKATLPATP